MAPILHPYNLELLSIIETDTSDFALRAILSQRHEEHLHPINFYSHKFHPDEVNYKVYDKEMLAIEDSQKQWQHYLEDAKHPFIVYTDHKNREYFLTTKSLNHHQASWLEMLANYDFTIIYRKGSSNGKAHVLSRHSEYRPRERYAQEKRRVQGFLKLGQYVREDSPAEDGDS